MKKKIFIISTLLIVTGLIGAVAAVLLTGQNSSTKSAANSAEATGSQHVEHDHYFLTLKEFGVKIPIDNTAIADATYRAHYEYGIETIELSTKQSDAGKYGSSCKSHNSVDSSGGFIIRGQEGMLFGPSQSPIESIPGVVRINNYYYLYQAPYQLCSDDGADEKYNQELMAISEAFRSAAKKIQSE